jgi:hypothetical protein
MACMNLRPREEKLGGSWSGISDHIPAARANCAWSGTTPTTVNGCPFNRVSRPTTEGSAPKTVTPGSFAHDHDRGGRARRIGGQKRAAENGFHAEHVEEPRCHGLPIHALHRAVGCGQQRAAADTHLGCRHCLEHLTLFVPIAQVERRHGHPKRSWASVLSVSLPDHHQAIGVGEREVAQQRGVGEGEHRAVGADTKRQRQRRDEGEAGRRFQLPEGKAHIVSPRLDPLGHTHLTFSLSAKVDARAFQLSEVADPRQDDVARRLRIEAALDELTRAHLDVQ